MSQCVISNAKYGERKLNVLAFSAPMSGQITSAQLRLEQHHYPIRSVQPNLTLSLMFATEKDFADFQTYIRNVQLDSLSSSTPGLTVNWPERNLNNYTGLPKMVPGGGSRANYSPKAELSIDLLDSLVSKGQGVASVGSDWRAIYGLGAPGGVQDPSNPTNHAGAPASPGAGGLIGGAASGPAQTGGSIFGNSIGAAP